MNKVLIGDVREKLLEIPDDSIQMCVTSPPYWGLRDYGVAGQIGLEKTPEEYVAIMVDVFQEVRRTLKDDGTLWLNLGDSYAGSGQGWGRNPKQMSNRGSLSITQHHASGGNKKPPGYISSEINGLKPKDLVGIPWMVAFALRKDGWYLRSDIIWHKPNPMPESVTDRPTRAHEYLFLFSKRDRYYYNQLAIMEQGVTAIDSKSGHLFGGKKNNEPNSLTCHSNKPGKKWKFSEMRNRWDVWSITTAAFKGAHFATFPPDLIKPCIRAGSKKGDTVLDPFVGSGTTLEVAERLGRNSIGIELNEEYVRWIIEPRMAKVNPLFAVGPINSTNGA